MNAASLVLGLMSGTSLDGVDCALCACRGRTRIKLLKLWSVAFPPGLRRRLRSAASGEAGSWETGQLHHDLGRFFAQAARQKLGKVLLTAVGLHGQTIFHRSHSSQPATFQIGEPAYLAEALRVPVISNFRAADIAAGGEGAPLATLFHRVVFARRGRFIAVNNLGGISNVTGLDWTHGGSEPQVQAFDTGPANILLDLAVSQLSHGRRQYDADGRWAGRGWIAHKLVEQWLQQPFFRRSPPKSTGREEFGEEFWRQAAKTLRRKSLRREDILATLTWFTARSIALSCEWHLKTPDGRLPDQVILCGGGAANPVLRKQIELALAEFAPSIRVQSVTECGWAANAVEPAAFALLAHYRLRGWPANLATTTGARRACRLGQISLP